MKSIKSNFKVYKTLVNIPGYEVLLHSQGYYSHPHYPLRYTFKLTVV